MNPNAEKFGKHKIIIANTRTFNNYPTFKSYVDQILKSLDKTKIEIVSGCENGPDTMAIKYAKEVGFKCWYFKPDWAHFGKSARLTRDKFMVDFSTHCIVFHDDVSEDNNHLIEEAKINNLLLRVIRINSENRT